jgi:hypothetical protein
VIELSDAQARRLRLLGQRLLDRPDAEATVHAVVRDSGGLQAQDVRAYPLSLRARLRGATAQDVVRARVEERSVVRNWYIRGTLHLVAAEDAAWLLSLIGERTVRASQTRRLGMGIDEDTYARALRIVRELLAGGPAPRAAIAARLRERGIDPSGQRNLHILQRAAMEGVVCHGPPAGGGADSAFVLTADWLGDAWREPLPSRDARLAELARRHLAAHAPAAPRDLATWAGVAMPEAREAYRLIAAQLLEVRVRGEAAWILAAQRDAATAPAPPGPQVRLLPVFDGYLLGHRSRGLVVAGEHAHHVLPGGGWLNPTVAVDGLAVALWSTEKRRDGLQATVHPYAQWRKRWEAGVDAEMADLARFREVSVSWRLAGA